MNLLKIYPITIINCDKYRKLRVKTLKYYRFSSVVVITGRYLKEESIEILKVFDLIGNING